MKINCPNCNTEIHIDHEADGPNTLSNGEYGCDTGCLYVRLNVECDCGFSNTVGTFGEFMNLKEAQEFLKELVDEL